ncbi:HupE/UreJ family protein [Polymorphum gilvum]|uniref:Hydrogenase accessory protein-like protein n=1 Tax=Polymorphum gilvum (strain LMG 25793 / CGMCC 1.9160 / SL003B-26A1) TaxID=991905 RepID=F2IXD6_POLGS|nr:HupE/UreJ family protein [Polymorphum gilvum]ADZ70454.1 Hydrogenase accessory protein-like protein [Polymorphum gilvum SL003B-26A1]
MTAFVKTRLFATPLARLGALVLATLAAAPASAHHMMDGEMPQTFVQGLLSGLGHPVIGIDHLAFVVAVGIAAGLLGRSLLLPAAFVVATVAGVVVHLQSVDLPLAELVIAASVLAVGALIVTGTALPRAGWAALFALAGLFHGYAYGESIVGAEPAPLYAYFLGFAVIQTAIASLAMLLTAPRAAGQAGALMPRLVGAGVVGVGLSALSAQLFG